MRHETENFQVIVVERFLKPDRINLQQKDDHPILPVVTLLDKLIEEDGGPLIWPAISESAQNAFDATCRKLYQYLNQASPD